MICEEIAKQVQVQSSLRNAEVIDRAFCIRDRVCCNCHYPENHAFFNYFLAEYKRVKLALFRLKRRDSFVIDSQLYDKVKAFWPCSDCMLRFNPTGRSSGQYRLVTTRIGTTISVHSKIHWESLVDNVNCSFRYIEATDHTVKTVLINPADEDRFLKGMAIIPPRFQTNIAGFPSIHIWGGKLELWDCISVGNFVCESERLK